VPSLRERREDLPVLLNHMLHKYRERHQRDVTGFTGRAIDAMLNYGWPGNIREMENLTRARQSAGGRAYAGNYASPTCLSA
jgi:two-component system response regulator HydG